MMDRFTGVREGKVGELKKQHIWDVTQSYLLSLTDKHTSCKTHLVIEYGIVISKIYFKNNSNKIKSK